MGSNATIVNVPNHQLQKFGRGGGAITSRNCPNLASAISNVRAGKGRARIMKIGDSTTAGYQQAIGYVGAYSGAPFQVLAKNFSSVAPAISASICGDQNVGAGNYPTYDTRTVMGSFVSTGGANQLGANSFSASSAGTLTFNPGVNCDTAEIYYQTLIGLPGTANINVNGGATLATLQVNAATGFQKAVVNFALGANTLNVAWVTGDFLLHGIVMYNSTASAVDFIQAGWSGMYSGDLTLPWQTVGNPTSYAPINEAPVYSPNAIILDIGINDAFYISDVFQNIKTFSSQMAAQGIDMILEIPFVLPFALKNEGAPSDPRALINQVRAFANDSGYPVIDLTALLTNAGINTTDYIHPTAIGYAQIARAELLALSAL